MKIALSPEVEAALAERRPVVALESTVVAHGMPYPTNLEVARETQDAVRDAGALPAMIGIVAGTLTAGLSDATIADFAQRDDVAKVSRRDLAAQRRVQHRLLCRDPSGWCLPQQDNGPADSTRLR